MSLQGQESTAVRQLPLPQPTRASHWAYQAPQRPDRAIIAEAGSNPIDVLLASKWQGAGVVASGPEQRVLLARRIYLDVIGLPPSTSELAEYMADDEPGAYERLVDRLLASPHFGERWAVPWLDLARYGDTNGYNFDGRRSVWLYRDWVIDAINDDMPFDRFTVEQLAGDLLPDASESTRVATGFHRNTMLNNEGGVDPKEARWERLLDRASTTGTTWLGSTFHCAQCHDHKYDPISQREFYGLVAFFETADEVTIKREDGVKTLAFREQPRREPRTPFHVRGAYDNVKGEVVAHLPAALAPSLDRLAPKSARRDRLLLARWLMSEGNPLTARVAANRIWTEIFGQSLVDTPEDWGMQAKRPLHLDLIDWLATEYVRVGWSRKRLIRAIVTSQTYRRSARATAAQRSRDPQNRYYGRSPRYRLDAERIRDVWLVASGLISRKVGGPSVYPVQADTSGVTPMNKVSMRWPTSQGEDRWRRGLYTFWRRTAPFVALDAFDAPSREVCVVRRERSNTPLQALVGLNDPTAVACAEALAERMRQQPGTALDQLAFGFAACVQRTPESAELEALVAAFDREPAEQRWQRIAIVLLNLDETLSRP
ncbi:MAG: DUF1549 and DUF1553 domain-containing protein [Planctomycetota bacterium]